MQQHRLTRPRSAKRQRRRIGRGDGSGHGSFSGRGMKGQKSRTGGTIRLGFQGGALPLIKSLPMVRGFTNIFRREYAVVNLDRLSNVPANREITPRSLVEMGILKDTDTPVKVLGRGELEVPLIIEAHKFSASAKTKIEAAGGSVREIA